ncbi:SDR family oxidoreductase [Spiroplasma endosymbiont of Labia minor]|uniref:SDR family oxidoreductase n=1 Tax=Spiroplasma endosymbiont of Labia minor TaxID=3066305 RepID=UPI0030D5C912
MSNNKQLVVITGASSGIGMALAKIFSKNGHPLLIIARRLEILQKLNLPDTMCKQVDVRDFTDFKNAILDAEKIYGKTDLLINNAGIMPLEIYSGEDLQEKYDIVDINLKGVINGIDCVLKDMIVRKHGTIVNVSSVAGRWTSDAHAVYNASKFGVTALTEAIRRENASSNVRFITIEPAIVDTDLLLTGKNKKLIDEYNVVKSSINNGLTSDEVAEVIFYSYNLPQHVNLKEIVLSHTLQKI